MIRHWKTLALGFLTVTLGACFKPEPGPGERIGKGFDEMYGGFQDMAKDDANAERNSRDRNDADARDRKSDIYDDFGRGDDSDSATDDDYDRRRDPRRDLYNDGRYNDHSRDSGFGINDEHERY